MNHGPKRPSPTRLGLMPNPKAQRRPADNSVPQEKLCGAIGRSILPRASAPAACVIWHRLTMRVFIAGSSTKAEGLTTPSRCRRPATGQFPNCTEWPTIGVVIKWPPLQLDVHLVTPQVEPRTPLPIILPQLYPIRTRARRRMWLLQCRKGSSSTQQQHQQHHDRDITTMTISSTAGSLRLYAPLCLVHSSASPPAPSG
jgi:hypothetical protein